MIRISSSSTGRSLALILLIALGAATPLEALAEEDEAPGSRKTSTPQGEGSKTEVREPEPEFELIQTPFGTIRQPKARSRSTSRQAATGQESPPATDPQEEAAPVESGDSPQVSAEAAAPETGDGAHPGAPPGFPARGAVRTRPGGAVQLRGVQPAGVRTQRGQRVEAQLHRRSQGPGNS